MFYILMVITVASLCLNTRLNQKLKEAREDNKYHAALADHFETLIIAKGKTCSKERS